MRRPRPWVIGALIAAAATLGAVIPACEGVLGIDNYTIGSCPSAGTRQCTDAGVPQECGQNGKWFTQWCEDNDDGGVPLRCDESGDIVRDTPCDSEHQCVSATGACKNSRMDVLLVVRNGPGMVDVQGLLQNAVPDLVRDLVNPKCVEPDGGASAQQPDSPIDSCPSPTAKRAFSPLLDIHIGVMSTSLGAHGAGDYSLCPDVDTSDKVHCDGGNSTMNDMGHLVSRTDSCSSGSVTTYQDGGFLAWDPRGALRPPGETQSDALDSKLQGILGGVGAIGCSLGSDLESWYRFLADPDPYQTITADFGGVAHQQGTDSVLLQQRSDFLRPDSLLVILLISDKNDCSIREDDGAEYYAAAVYKDSLGGEYHLPKPRSECATDPNDPCCASCTADAGSACPSDPACDGQPLDGGSDPYELRCWDQKRRFGVDFLYPVDRYVTGLTAATVPTRDGGTAPNPLFSTDADGNALRDKSMVYFAAIVGVPWQDLARDAADITGGFKSADEMSAESALLDGGTAWDLVIGDPATYVSPLDPHMIESVTPRSGKNPITGDTIAPPSASGEPDSISGHEYTTSGDLQFACIFPLAQPRDCAQAGDDCDCSNPTNDSPLCAVSDAGTPTIQTYAEAYPGIRQLTLVKALGKQGIAGSLCVKQASDSSSADYGYRPVVSALISAIAGKPPSSQ